jgi:hypothetical protein
MSRIMVDDMLPQILPRLIFPVELCDASGRVLGTFTPATDPSEWEGLEPEISEEELAERLREEGGRTTEDILADWEKRK